MEKKPLLSIRDLSVKFRVRGRTLTAIRRVSLDIFEDESIAIVGESGCGKSVLTKTFAGMLDNNGFIDSGDILFNEEEFIHITAPKNKRGEAIIAYARKHLNRYAKLQLGADIYKQIVEEEKKLQERMTLSEQDAEAMEERRKDLVHRRTEIFNRRQTYDTRSQRGMIQDANKELAVLDRQIKELDREKQRQISIHKAETKADKRYLAEHEEKLRSLKQQYKLACQGDLTPDMVAFNKKLAKEVYLSVWRYADHKRTLYLHRLLRCLEKAMRLGIELEDYRQLNAVFENVVLRVNYLEESDREIKGRLWMNLAKKNCIGDWSQIRGRKIATIFQDPMTSLNPIITIGKQISSIIIKHQHVSEQEARIKAIQLMKKVGIPNAENRYDDYPFQYSGGMRQRIVIAIALCCHPKILICDEPTTALDVTIQAQILKLIKDLQKEFHYTIVFITHDLGVVANIADRVAVLYAGQIVEIGTTEEVFYDPRHPYTWVLLSSLPQLMDRKEQLYSIAGTPPSLYNKIKGDAFAPRNPYCLKIDTVKEPPMFKVSETHYAKTWLLDPRAPKVEKPAIIQDIHGTLKRVFNV